MPMKDSKMTDQWIADTMARNPFQQLPNGNFLFFGRGSFCNLWHPAKEKLEAGASPNPNRKPSYNTSILMPPGSEWYIENLLEPWLRYAAQRDFPNNFTADGQMFGLNPVFRPQAEKPQYKGYTPGLAYTMISTQVKPKIVDVMGNPIVDESRVYPGVWLMCACNIYASGKNQPRKGPRFGIQSLMVIGDDERIDDAGGGDPKADFAGVQVDANYNAAAAMGGAPGMPPRPPGNAIMPPAQPAYGAPPAGYAAPPAPAYQPPRAPAYRPPATLESVI